MRRELVGTFLRIEKRIAVCECLRGSPCGGKPRVAWVSEHLFSEDDEDVMYIVFGHGSCDAVQVSRSQE